MEDNISIKFFYIIKGVIISIIFTLIFLFVFSIILTYTNVSEKFIDPVIIISTAISIFIGSSIGNLKMKKNGVLNGACVGGIYLLIIYVLSGIMNRNFTLSTQSLIIIVAGMVCGIFGGIIGVNKN